MIAATRVPITAGLDDHVGQLLAHVAAFGLGAERPQPMQPFDAGTWQRLIQGARRERLIGLLSEMIRADALPATEPQAVQVEHMATRAMAHCLLLERMAVRAYSALGYADIPARVLKGVAVAHLDYPDPAWRPYIDADILVPTGRIEQAAGVLRSLGLERQVAPLSARYEDRFMKSATFADSTRRQLDVHRTLAIGPVGLAIPQADLWAGSQELVLGGVALQALDRPRRTMHAAVTVAVADWPARLIAQRDLAELLLFDYPDYDALWDLADRWRARPVLLQAIADTWTNLGLPDDSPSGLAEVLGGPPSQIDLDTRSRRLLALYRRERRSFPRLALAGFRVIPSVDRANYAHAFLVPDRRHVKKRLRTIWRRRRWGHRSLPGSRR